MNIILLGNGFDLAHDLPTTYTNFLDFMKKIDPSYDEKNKLKLNPQIDKLINDSNNADSINKIQQLCTDNIWLEYFSIRNNLYPNWCDFESEIEYITKNLEKMKKELETTREIASPKFYKHPSFDFLLLSIRSLLLSTIYKSNLIESYSIDFLRNKLPGIAILTLGNNTFTFNKMIEDFPRTESFAENLSLPFEFLINFILKQLNDFTKCFEIYLSIFINQIDIQKIYFINELIDKRNLKILNFNYTNTIEHYKLPYDADICYIHGKACNDDNNNLVLGINETESKIDPMFTRFRKYFQRIEKDCAYNYRAWINSINYQNRGKQFSLGAAEHNLYILGHSLTLNDKNILNELITLPGMSTTIYYYSDDSKLNLMENLASILGYQKFTDYREAEAVKFIKGNFEKKVTKTLN